MVNKAPTPEEQFGVQLRRLREQADLTVRALAGRLHRAHSGIVEYEGGRRLPGVEVVEQYEDFFEQPRGTLLAQRERARMLRLERPRDATPAGYLGTGSCPYPGLRAFARREAAMFFGREAEVACVAARLPRSRLAAVVGASGSGKSSFVRAGLLASVEVAAPLVPIALLTPGRRPLDALAAAVGNALAPPQAPRARDRGVGAAAAPGLVLVVDQLEELFTLCDDEGERASFVEALLTAWRHPASPVTLILALRSDARERVDAYPELAAVIDAEQTLLGPMSTGDLRRAIERPAAASGLLLQPGFTETILEDLANQPGALPLMAEALRETWKRRRRLTLTISAYREAGGLRGAITQTAEHTLRDMPAEDLAVAQAILLRLTDVREGAEPSGLRVDRRDLIAMSRPAPATDRVLDVLATARLVTLDASTVEFGHEEMIRHWPRLREWIDADRATLLVHRRLALAAGEWASLGCDADALYRGSRLVAARGWANERADDLNPNERAFLAASETHALHELREARSRARRLHALAAGIALLATIVAVIAAWALQQRDKARRKASGATSIALVWASASAGESRPDIGALSRSGRPDEDVRWVAPHRRAVALRGAAGAHADASLGAPPSRAHAKRPVTRCMLSGKSAQTTLRLPCCHGAASIGTTGNSP